MCSLQADHHHLLASSASAIGFHQKREMKQWLSFFFNCVSNLGIGNFPSSLLINIGRLFLIKKKKSQQPHCSLYIHCYQWTHNWISHFLFLCVSIKKPIRLDGTYTNLKYLQYTFELFLLTLKSLLLLQVKFT